ncbi:MAG TPA: DUF2207 domain-containing protein [Candidatus Acidoferrales bacterium]|nr:DUF2207 domain-containing protein [Candidatus Acidoferrales bacterium]
MKRLVFFSLLLLLLFIPPRVHADDSWVIENFHSDIAIQQKGTVKVVERIAVDFRNQPKHGIYRDIPYEYDSGGNKTYTQVDITSVLQNNTPARYTTTQSNGYEEIKIGDPNHTITGRTVYSLTYTVTGVLRGFNDHDELYWNVTGNDWAVVIQKAEATVSLPKQCMIKSTCYEGSSGSQTLCQSKSASPQVATFAATEPLGEYQGLTIVVGYKKGLVPLLTAKPPKTFLEKFIEWPSIMIFISTVLIGIGVIGYLWYRYGRDFWFAGILFGTKDQQGKAKPIGAQETTSVEFTPPEKLRPAEIGVLMDERADTLDVVATIIDLATRGYLTITEVPKKWLFGKVDYLLTKSTPKQRLKAPEILSYEQLLLDKLFYKRSQIKISSLKKTFYEELKEVKQALYDDVVAKQLFPFDPEKTRKKYLVAGIVLAALGAGLFFPALNTDTVLSAEVGLGLIVSGGLFLLMFRFMPRKTAYGRELYRRSKGYYLFIDRAEKYRQRYFEKENMFNEVLPYAIVFGLTKKFAKKMETIGLKPEQTSWYVGSHAFATGAFLGSIDDFSHSMSAAMATTPSSSGGFSGGSSGGGFGGGGGGSW